MAFSNLRGFPVTYEWFIAAGLIMMVFTLVKLLGVADFSSDWFWFIAGLLVVIEGSILLSKQKKFDRKYKVVLREGS